MVIFATPRLALALILVRYWQIILPVFLAFVFFGPKEPKIDPYKPTHVVENSTITIMDNGSCWKEARRLGMWFAKKQDYAYFQNIKGGTYGQSFDIRTSKTLSGTEGVYPNEHGDYVSAHCNETQYNKPYIETIDKKTALSLKIKG